jgi:isoleucyl-tRNA synthetase
MEKSKDYKHTLNLPKTDMPMRANLANRENEILERWAKLDIYNFIKNTNKEKTKFILHDGPPYANGRIHMGHVLNKVLKDIVLKYKIMAGFNCPFVPGWDCHGLPVEHQLFKELKITKDQISRVDFRKKAKEYALKHVDIQRAEFERLGVFADWQKPYLTLNNVYEAQIVKSFAELVKKNYIYKGRKPVNWCAECETALAEAEVEYEDRLSPSVYVKFKLTKDAISNLMSKSNLQKLKNYSNDDFYVLVWTTTPWTLVSNVAIALSSKLQYKFIKVNGEIWFLADDLIEKLIKKIEIKDYSEVATINGGDELLGLRCEHPFIKRESIILTADYVSGEDGTGCVHTAPGHGQDDYLTYLKYKDKFDELKILMPINDKGKFDETAGEFSGLNIYQANKSIIERLRNNESLLLKEDINHSYPHCWRCKKPIIFRATEQWFMSIDHNNFRDKLLDAIDKDVQWIPQFGKARIQAMVENRPDWCLSRQRYWGVPVPVISCNKCKQPLLDYNIIAATAERIEKEGLSIWYEKEAVYFLPDNFKCPKCSSSEFSKEDDILDVWFDSGVSHQAVLRQRDELKFPADLYLEGSDQHRGWFQTSLITAMAIEENPCYKQVLTHGFIVDGKGKKMSKSSGNAVSPDKIINQMGADILRLWVAFSDYNHDVGISDEILQRVSDAYRKIRNTLRFVIGNLSDYDHSKDNIDYDCLLEIDKWALDCLKRMHDDCLKLYDAYELHKVIQKIYNFCTVDMSSFYLDVLKDRLYTWAATSDARRSAQTVLFNVAVLLNKIIAPILPFTAEEIYSYLPNVDKKESIFVDNFDKNATPDIWTNDKVKDEWNKISIIRNIVLKALEQKRMNKEIGNALEAEVVLYVTNSELLELLNKHVEVLADVFIVSKVRLMEVEKIPAEAEYAQEVKDLGVAVKRSDGVKCPRCWRYVEKFDERQGLTEVCSMCADAIDQPH